MRGFPSSKERVERLMQENGIKAKHKRRFKVTTDSKHNPPVAPNLLDRNFTPDAPNQVWTSDITYLWTGEGWLYLAIVLDLFNREVVGWSLKPRMTADIATDALTMAWFRRKPAAGLIHHSDRGSQYASHAFQAKLKEYGMICSMPQREAIHYAASRMWSCHSRKGNCWDNAPTESWFGSFKNERVYGERFETRDEMMAMAFEYIEVFYNRKRLHSTLGYKSPVQFLADWLNAQLKEKLVACPPPVGRRKTEERSQFHSVTRRLNLIQKLVGVGGFELPTSCSQSRRATRLRYTPKGANIATSALPVNFNLQRIKNTSFANRAL